MLSVVARQAPRDRFGADFTGAASCGRVRPSARNEPLSNLSVFSGRQAHDTEYRVHGRAAKSSQSHGEVSKNHPQQKAGDERGCNPKWNFIEPVSQEVPHFGIGGSVRNDRDRYSAGASVEASRNRNAIRIELRQILDGLKAP